MTEVSDENHLLNLFHILYKEKWLISLFLILGAIIGLVYNVLTETTRYKISSTLIINKEQSNIFYESSYTQEDFLMYEKVLNTYLELATSDVIINKVAPQFSSYTNKQIKNMVSVKNIPETFLLEISVQGTDPDELLKLNQSYTKTVIEECYRILPVGHLTIVEEAKLPTSPLPSKRISTLCIGALLGLLIAFCIIYFKSFKYTLKMSISQQTDNI